MPDLVVAPEEGEVTSSATAEPEPSTLEDSPDPGVVWTSSAREVDRAESTELPVPVDEDEPALVLEAEPASTLSSGGDNAPPETDTQTAIVEPDPKPVTIQFTIDVLAGSRAPIVRRFWILNES